MDLVLRDKVKIGISMCCYGAKVRYNSKGWNLVENLGREKSNFIWYPVCPECMAGLGVPRNPIKIVGKSGMEAIEGTAKVKSSGGENVTEKLVNASKVCLDTLKSAGVYIYIYKEGSPSCGVYRTTLKNKRLGKPPGVFGAMLLKEDFLLISADDLESPIKRWDIRRRIHAYVWVKEYQINSKSELYDLFHSVKFLVQEIDEVAARKIGREIANAGKIDSEYVEKFKKEVLNIIRKPSELKKIKGWMFKNYSYYRKRGLINYEIKMEPRAISGSTKLANEIMKVEKELFKAGYSFGSSPILYRGR
ncbi:MAG: DUF523 domain-containing protein [Clostridia bacterium]|jgi:uncharacterized protein YbbK (DUF523 family)|nr:DUF523 domain-containing protein [Clostridia bacterium]